MTLYAGQGVAANLASFLTTVILAANGNAAPAQGGSSEAFWNKAVREGVTHLSALQWAADGTVTLEGLLELVQARPAKPEFFDIAPQQPGQTTANALTSAAWHWQQTSPMAKMIQRAATAPVHPMPASDFRAAVTYCTKTLANPDQRVPGNLTASLSADLAPLMQGALHTLFGTTTNVVPEMTHHGAIIVMHLPLKEFGEAGLLGQQLMKLAWQKAAERRAAVGNPLFLFADEGHLFVNPYDAEFQSTARSSRVASICLSQNLPAFYERIGGRNPQHTAESYLANFGTKIFHANTCVTTNEFAAKLVGKKLMRRKSWGANEGLGDSEGKNINYDHQHPVIALKAGTGKNRNTNRNQGRGETVTEQMDFIIQPGEFADLRTGGPQYRRKVDAVMVGGGRTFRSTGHGYTRLIFTQARS